MIDFIKENEQRNTYRLRFCRACGHHRSIDSFYKTNKNCSSCNEELYTNHTVKRCYTCQRALAFDKYPVVINRKSICCDECLTRIDSLYLPDEI